MSKEESSQGKARGFAGLADIGPPPPPPPSAPAVSISASANAPALSKTTIYPPAPEHPTPKPPPPDPHKTNFTPWVIGALVLGVLWMIADSSKNGPASAPSSYSPSYQSPIASSPLPPVAYTPPAPPVESPPPIGAGYALDDSQIRYCLAQKIRIGVWENATQTNNSADIDRFNARVDDYNARCGHFRYRRGALERVTAEVDGERARVESMAREAWLVGRPLNPDPAPSRYYPPAAPAYPAYRPLPSDTEE